MLRIFCNTNRCGYLSQAGSRDRALNASSFGLGKTRISNG